MALIGGAAATAEIITELQHKGLIPLRCYGATETTAMVSCQGINEAGEEHCGRLLGASQALITADKRLRLRGAQLATEAITPDGPVALGDDQGWLSTGDCATLDAQQRLSILGRSDGAIHSGGLTIFPEKIEEIIGKNPWHAACCLIPLEHSEWGQCLGAAVASSDQACIEGLQGWCATRLAPEQRPKAFLFVSACRNHAMAKSISKRLGRCCLRILKTPSLGDFVPIGKHFCQFFMNK